MRLLCALARGRRRRSGAAPRLCSGAPAAFLEREAPRRPGLRGAGADPAGRGRDRPGDRRATSIRTRSTRPARGLRRRIGQRPARRAARRCATSLHRRTPTAPMRRAPGGAPCATSRSICWPRPTRDLASASRLRQFETRRQHDGPARRARRADDPAGRGPRTGASRASSERYRDEPLVLDKWFTLQAAIPEAGTLDRVRRLMDHPAFSLDQSEPRPRADRQLRHAATRRSSTVPTALDTTSSPTS